VPNALDVNFHAFFSSEVDENMKASGSGSFASRGKKYPTSLNGTPILGHRTCEYKTYYMIKK
jgi:hypothetical protein